MPQFDPTKRSGGGGGASTVTAGRYVLGIVWFKRKTSSKGSDYLSVKYEIASGPEKGRTFFSMLGLDVDKPGTAVRWSLLCESCGITESFELGSRRDGTADEGDQAIQDRFLGKAFVGQVGVEQNGQYTNNSVDKIIPPRNCVSSELDAIRKWTENFRSQKGDFDAPDDGGGNYDDLDNRSEDPWDDLPI